MSVLAPVRPGTTVIYTGRLVEHQDALCKIVDFEDGFYTLKVLTFDRNVREILIVRVPIENMFPTSSNF